MRSKYVKQQYHLSALTGKIIAAAQSVHHHIGPGFREVIYQRALALELEAYGLDHEREVWINVHFKDLVVGRLRVDFVIGDETGSVLVEIKAHSKTKKVFYVQALSYLRASGYKIGLLLNFGRVKLDIKRLAN